MKRSLFSLAVIVSGFMTDVAQGASCLEHRWYHQATVAEHWTLLAHKLESERYQVITAPDKVATAAALLEREAAKVIPEELARALGGRLPHKAPTEEYFLVRGLGYSAPSGRLYVYAHEDSLMVGYSYLGPLEHLPVMEIPVVVALSRMPRNIYTGCSGAS